MKTRSGIEWTFNGVLGHEDRMFITTYVPTIYWNDATCRHWIYDFKLPSGRWVECCEVALEDITRIKGTIFDPTTGTVGTHKEVRTL